MNPEIQNYNSSQNESDQEICSKLSELIDENLNSSENKIWHSHPVWFLDGNPIVGYSKEKKGLRLMFWSGKSFNEVKLNVEGRKFQDASIFYNDKNEIDEDDLKRWLEKSKEIQWDYKNIVKRKGELIRLK
ncbi:DUF1801 domain-containing protein [Chryseobacterium wangxinyae]|uniref:DUF1801 domain-containing protein n=1 Tax=unclassified Chryseobacterium TaxID=2593645 RepID=UPI002270DD4B|nr:MULTISPECIES: DUF1801 domain-containing protein [unclassified Chryseobacterium]MCY0969406.1 DUF1801 domain-containing protein [Chryseobacterium sp. CY353]MCY0976569.1 DUF1801 domain-containing protein [Chryseobacterium sp. CY350]WBZ96572.1 DUF1801 domain-containing protein [Chryseobacterium sp. CY350]